MHVAYVIAAHKNARQLTRLLNTIESPGNTYVLHVDRRANSAVHAAARAFVETRGDRSAVALRPQKILWGHWSMVSVQIAGIKAALAANQNWRHLINLSGQCYPLRPAGQIEAELAAAGGQSFMEILDFEKSTENAHKRLKWFYFPCRDKMKKLWRRRPIRGTKIWWGSQWYVLSREACEYMVSEPALKRLRRYFYWSLIPDEMYFQTALMNSPLADSIVRDNKRLIMWQGGPNPKTLTMDDWPMVQTSPAWFARKFDDRADPRILDALDQRLAGR